MNEYFRRAKNKGSLKSNRKLLTVKPLANRSDILVHVKKGS